MTVKYSAVYSCPEITVGWGLDALVYSFYTGCPLILTESIAPHPFEFLSLQEMQLEPLAGIKKLDLYNFLIFNLSMDGLLPFGGQVSSFERSDDGLKVVTNNAMACFFRTSKVSEIYPDVDLTKKVVLDWISVRSGLRHDHERIENSSDFAKSIIFYPSNRIDGSASSNLKDAVAISYMTEEQILDANYSPFYVKMKAAEMMKDAGIRGPKNGIGPKGQRYRPLVLESQKREVHLLTKSKLEIPKAVSISPVVYL